VFRIENGSALLGAPRPRTRHQTRPRSKILFSYSRTGAATLRRGRVHAYRSRRRACPARISRYIAAAHRCGWPNSRDSAMSLPEHRKEFLRRSVHEITIDPDTARGTLTFYVETIPSLSDGGREASEMPAAARRRCPGVTVDGGTLGRFCDNVALERPDRPSGQVERGRGLTKPRAIACTNRWRSSASCQSSLDSPLPTPTTASLAHCDGQRPKTPQSASRTFTISGTPSSRWHPSSRVR